MIEAILWPLGSGIWPGALVLILAVVLLVALFIVCTPFAAVNGIRRYRERAESGSSTEGFERLAQLL